MVQEPVKGNRGGERRRSSRENEKRRRRGFDPEKSPLCAQGQAESSGEKGDPPRRSKMNKKKHNYGRNG